MARPRTLTIAGSDSSGGAGIEADLKTFTVHGCYGMTCITGLTAQNTLGVRKIYPVDDPAMIEETLDAVFEDVGVDAVKTGMLSKKATVTAVAAKLRALHAGKPIVVDPVMISTSGHRLIADDAIETYVNDLLPLATVITPNINEAHAIAAQLGEKPTEIKSIDDIKALAKLLHSKIGTAVLLKGGHAGLGSDNAVAVPGNEVRVADVLYDGNQFTEFVNDFVVSKSTHGTGCTLASAIAANLARGDPLVPAVDQAIKYVQSAIQHATPIGKGNGPVDHLFNVQTRPYVLGNFVPYLLAHPKVAPHWQKYVNHPFTKQLARGKLPMDQFVYFLTQDYLYLKHYARAHSLAGFKTEDIDAIKASSTIVNTITSEQALHVDYCGTFGLSERDLVTAEEAQATYAYSRYILDIGSKEDWLGLQTALSPCLFGYLEAAANRVAEKETVEAGNPYWKWIETYTDERYRGAAETGRVLLETHVGNVSAARVEELVDIFATATRMEVAFWDAALASGVAA